MKRALSGLLPLLCAVVLNGCSTVPIVGRRQATLMPESQMAAQSATSYGQVLKESKLSTDQKQTALVRSVGGRIANAVEQFMRENGMEKDIANFKWEFNLIEDETPNAWCMPGGKVAFYTGILPFTQDEAGIAVVMGHEVAHAVAKHGSERVSHQMIQQGLGAAVNWASSQYYAQYQSVIMQVYGYGSQYGVILPYSRKHESEADRLGLIFMSMAGYDPNAAVAFWQRMAAGKDGAPLEFMSTHPSDQTRITKLQASIPEAMKYYKAR
ncbi:MAG: M48 family metallopeptidase [Kiritimatiellales bacterium]|nr:M48 family metallopeptidase [Kiritimatiellales bacterium]